MNVKEEFREFLAKGSLAESKVNDKDLEKAIHDIVYSKSVSWEENFLGWYKDFKNHKDFLKALYELLISIKKDIKKDIEKRDCSIDEYFEEYLFSFLDRNKTFQDKVGDY